MWTNPLLINRLLKLQHVLECLFQEDWFSEFKRQSLMTKNITILAG